MLSIALVFGLGLYTFHASARIAADSSQVKAKNIVEAEDIEVDIPDVIIRDVSVEIKINILEHMAMGRSGQMTPTIPP